MGASLALHALIVTRLIRPTETPPPVPPPPLVWFDAPPPPVEPPPTQRTTTAPRPPRRVKPVERTGEPTGQVDQPSAPLAHTDGPPLATDTPRALSLVPRPALDSDTISTTEQTVVTERVAGWAKSDVVAARTSSGLISPAYEPLRHALDRAVLTMPSFIDTDDPAAIGRAVIDGWQPGAERYARTGAAYDEPAGRLEGFERPSEFAAGIADARTRNALGFFAAGARLQEFADGRAGGSLIAEVEVLHAADGTLRTVRLVQASGHRGFDDFVLTQARTVADALALDGGVRDKPFRSLWRFTGTLTFRRKLGGLKDLTPRAALGSSPCRCSRRSLAWRTTRRPTQRGSVPRWAHVCLASWAASTRTAARSTSSTSPTRGGPAR